MKRAFISMPMAGKSDEQVKEEMDELKAIVESAGYQVADSIVADSDEAKNKPLFYLSKSLEILSSCDVLFMAEGWEYARGCRLERQAADKYGIDVKYFGDKEQW